MYSQMICTQIKREFFLPYKNIVHNHLYLCYVSTEKSVATRNGKEPKALTIQNTSHGSTTQLGRCGEKTAKFRG